MGITRQAAFDLFKNTDKKLLMFEQKLNLAKRFREIETLAKNIKEQTDDIKTKTLSEKIINLTIKGGNY